ncbi:MAG: hypothetical protein AB7G44_03545 [Bacteroidia bacterium]
MSKTATITTTKQTEQELPTLINLLGLTELERNNVEFETGLNLLYNTLKPLANHAKQFKRLSEDKTLGYWNWWMNYRKQQEVLFTNDILLEGFDISLMRDPEGAKQWLRRNWFRIHNDIKVSENAIYLCGEFVKNKL